MNLTRGEYAKEFLANASYILSVEHLIAIVAWQVAENRTPVDQLNCARYNPLDSTEPAFGDSFFNTFGNNLHVRNYPSLEIGLEAIDATLSNGYYDNIVSLLKDPSSSSSDIGRAIDNSPWGSQGVEQIVALVKNDYSLYANVQINAPIESTTTTTTQGEEMLESFAKDAEDEELAEVTLAFALIYPQAQRLTDAEAANWAGYGNKYGSYQLIKAIFDSNGVTGVDLNRVPLGNPTPSAGPITGGAA